MKRLNDVSFLHFCPCSRPPPVNVTAASSTLPPIAGAGKRLRHDLPQSEISPPPCTLLSSPGVAMSGWSLAASNRVVTARRDKQSIAVTPQV